MNRLVTRINIMCTFYSLRKYEYATNNKHALHKRYDVLLKLKSYILSEARVRSFFKNRVVKYLLE